MDYIMRPSYEIHKENQFTDENKKILENLGKLWINKTIAEDIQKMNEYMERTSLQRIMNNITS